MQNQQQKRQKKIQGKTRKAIRRVSPATASGEKLPAVALFRERNTMLGKRVKSKLTIPDNVHV